MKIALATVITIRAIALFTAVQFSLSLNRQNSIFDTQFDILGIHSRGVYADKKLAAGLMYIHRRNPLAGDD